LTEIGCSASLSSTFSIICSTGGFSNGFSVVSGSFEGIFSSTAASLITSGSTGCSADLLTVSVSSGVSI
jgi:hypothetical protein